MWEQVLLSCLRGCEDRTLYWNVLRIWWFILAGWLWEIWVVLLRGSLVYAAHFVCQTRERRQNILFKTVLQNNLKYFYKTKRLTASTELLLPLKPGGLCVWYEDKSNLGTILCSINYKVGEVTGTAQHLTLYLCCIHLKLKQPIRACTHHNPYVLITA